LSIDDISPFDAIKLLTYGLPHISPATIKHALVQNKDGPAEPSFQAALYSAFNGLLSTSMICLFEAKAKGREQLDLLVVDGTDRLAGYELKVNDTEADLRKDFKQAKGYADYYGITIYLLNFCLEGHVVPEAKKCSQNVVLVNITHPADCTQFSVSSFDWE